MKRRKAREWKVHEIYLIDGDCHKREWGFCTHATPSKTIRVREVLPRPRKTRRKK